MADAHRNLTPPDIARSQTRMPRWGWFLLATIVLVVGFVVRFDWLPWHREQQGVRGVEHVTMVERVSPLGLSLVCPDRWTASSEGQWWLLEDPDGSLLVSAYVCSIEGTGSLEDFRGFFAGIFTEGSDLSVGDWQPFAFVNGTGVRSSTTDATEQAARADCVFYCARDDLYYYAICVRTARIAIRVNAEFYDGISQTLCGIGHEFDVAQLKDRFGDDRCAHLGRWTRLTSLTLDGAPISDVGVRHLTSLSNLGVLNLAHTSVTDAGITHLKSLTNLATLDLSGTNVTDAGISELQLALPGLAIKK